MVEGSVGGVPERGDAPPRPFTPAPAEHPPTAAGPTRSEAVGGAARGPVIPRAASEPSLPATGGGLAAIAMLTITIGSFFRRPRA